MRFKQLRLIFFLSLSTLILGVIPEPEPITDPTCLSKKWPIVIGGNSLEEIRTMLIDETSQKMIVGGITTSDDFGLSADDHGFIYCLTLDGDWLWGHYFYFQMPNTGESWKISRVDHIFHSSSKTYINAFGQMIGLENQRATFKPFITKININTGQPYDFLYIQMTVPPGSNSDTPPILYDTLQAIYHQEGVKNIINNNDKEKINSYKNGFYYLIFMQIIGVERWMHMVMINDASFQIQTHRVQKLQTQSKQWHEISARQIIPNVLESNYIHIFGKFLTSSTKYINETLVNYQLITGGALKLYKYDMSQQSQLGFVKINQTQTDHDISSVTQLDESQDYSFIGCGYISQEIGINEKTIASFPIIFKLTNTGQKQIFNYKIDLQNCKCKSLVFDPTLTLPLVMLISTNNKDFRLFQSSIDADDSFILMMSENINNGLKMVSLRIKGKLDQFISNRNAFYINKKNVYIAGQLPIGAKNSDNVIIKYTLRNNLKEKPINSCLEDSYKSFYSQILTKQDSQLTQELRKEEQMIEDNQKLEAKNSSNGISGEMLKSSIHVPRLCGKSIRTNLIYQYCGGQTQIIKLNEIPTVNQTDIKIFQSLYNEMTESNNYQISFINNSNSNSIASLGSKKYELNISTSNEDFIDNHTLYLQGCSRKKQNFIELIVPTEIRTNNPPTFRKPLQTQDYFCNFSTNCTVQLPEIYDPDGNDIANATLKPFTDYDTLAEFISYDKIGNFFEFKPIYTFYEGNVYRFRLDLNEMNSPLISQSFFFSVYITHNENWTAPNQTMIKMSIPYFDYKGRGIIKFDYPVKTSIFLPQNKQYLDQLFQVEVRPVENKNPNEIIYPKNISYQVLKHNSDPKKINQTHVEFKIIFNDSHHYGLINRRHDLLMFRLISADDAQLQFLVIDRILHNISFDPNPNDRNITRVRIPNQFDEENEIMRYFKDHVAQKLTLYWILTLMGMFFICAWLWYKNHDFLPLWNMIDYMQLAALLPLFNFKIVPYCYQTFKSLYILYFSFPCWTTISENSIYFNTKHKYLEIPAHLVNNCLYYLLIFVLISGSHILLRKLKNLPKLISDLIQSKQLNYGFYLRLYQVAYLPLTYFAVMNIQYSVQNPFFSFIGWLIVIFVSGIGPIIIQIIIYLKWVYLTKDNQYEKQMRKVLDEMKEEESKYYQARKNQILMNRDHDRKQQELDDEQDRIEVENINNPAYAADIELKQNKGKQVKVIEDEKPNSDQQTQRNERENEGPQLENKQEEEFNPESKRQIFDKNKQNEDEIDFKMERTRGKTFSQKFYENRIEPFLQRLSEIKIIKRIIEEDKIDTLMNQIDHQYSTRTFYPIFYYYRRFFIVYIFATRPYNTFQANFFLIANEFLNYIQIMLIFFFTDATLKLDNKFFAANCFPFTLGLIPLLNLIHALYLSLRLYLNESWLDNTQDEFLNSRHIQYYKDMKELELYLWEEENAEQLHLDTLDAINSKYLIFIKNKGRNDVWRKKLKKAEERRPKNGEDYEEYRKRLQIEQKVEVKEGQEMKKTQATLNNGSFGGSQNSGISRINGRSYQNFSSSGIESQDQQNIRPNSELDYQINEVDLINKEFASIQTHAHEQQPQFQPIQRQHLRIDTDDSRFKEELNFNHVGLNTLDGL